MTGVPLAQAISVYFQCGGAENLANGLLCLSDYLLITGWGFDPPQELPLHGVYEAGKWNAEMEGCATCCVDSCACQDQEVGTNKPHDVAGKGQHWEFDRERIDQWIEVRLKERRRRLS